MNDRRLRLLAVVFTPQHGQKRDQFSCAQVACCASPGACVSRVIDEICRHSL
jgi:hypothetical protein